MKRSRQCLRPYSQNFNPQLFPSSCAHGLHHGQTHTWLNGLGRSIRSKNTAWPMLAASLLSLSPVLLLAVALPNLRTYGLRVPSCHSSAKWFVYIRTHTNTGSVASKHSQTFPGAASTHSVLREKTQPENLLGKQPTHHQTLLEPHA